MSQPTRNRAAFVATWFPIDGRVRIEVAASESVACALELSL